jgi:hypothetical protein
VAARTQPHPRALTAVSASATLCLAADLTVLAILTAHRAQQTLALDMMHADFELITGLLGRPDTV